MICNTLLISSNFYFLIMYCYNIIEVTSDNYKHNFQNELIIIMMDDKMEWPPYYIHTHYGFKYFGYPLAPLGVTEEVTPTNKKTWPIHIWLLQIIYCY